MISAADSVLLIDILLFVATICLAILSLTTRNLFKGIVLFISLGLVVTISWARLGAWDVAIAEAAIGAGLTGALLLVTWRKLKQTGGKKPPVNQQSSNLVDLAKSRNNRNQENTAPGKADHWQQRVKGG